MTLRMRYFVVRVSPLRRLPSDWERRSTLQWLRSMRDNVTKCPVSSCMTTRRRTLPSPRSAPSPMPSLLPTHSSTAQPSSPRESNSMNSPN
ncbi:hypothetical protein PMAYCL1PPCAC_21591, partial [Pristionchus mayeri]